MWTELRARRLGGFKFVRQAPIDRYFVDFLCREKMIVVEVDGGTHGSDAEIAYDETRTAKIEAIGYRVFRIHNIDVYENLDRVLDALLALCAEIANRADRPALPLICPSGIFSPQAGRRGTCPS